MKKGLFITFEGIDGAGKTTQIKLLGEKLRTHNKNVLFIREPGSTVIGEKVRDILLSPESREMSLVTEILLYTAARSQLVDEVIKPALLEGKVVVCDRYIHSTLAYQGFGSGFEREKILLINQDAMGGIWPDLTFVLDVGVEESVKRCHEKNIYKNNKDRIEQRGTDYYLRVRKGYNDMAEKDSRIVTIQPHLSVEDAHSMIWKELKRRIPLGI